MQNRAKTVVSGLSMFHAGLLAGLLGCAGDRQVLRVRAEQAGGRWRVGRELSVMPGEGARVQ